MDLFFRSVVSRVKTDGKEKIQNFTLKCIVYLGVYLRWQMVLGAR